MKGRASVIGVALMLTGCSSIPASTPAPVLTDLKDIKDLETRFDADPGAVRIVLLVSPT